MLSLATLCDDSAQPEAPNPPESNTTSSEPISFSVGVHALASDPETVTSDTALTDTIEIAETLSRSRQPIPSAVRSQPNDSQMDSPHEYIEDLPEWAMNSALVATSPP